MYTPDVHKQGRGDYTSHDGPDEIGATTEATGMGVYSTQNDGSYDNHTGRREGRHEISYMGASDFSTGRNHN